MLDICTATGIALVATLVKFGGLEMLQHINTGSLPPSKMATLWLRRDGQIGFMIQDKDKTMEYIKQCQRGQDAGADILAIYEVQILDTNNLALSQLFSKPA